MIRPAFIFLALLGTLQSGCSDQRDREPARSTASMAPGSVGTSGGGDVSGLIVEYQVRLQHIMRFLEKQQSLVIDSAGYEKTRPSLVKACTRLVDPELCVWDFEEQIVNNQPLVAFRCGEKTVTVDSRDLWQGVNDTFVSYRTLLDVMSRVDDIPLSWQLLNRLAQGVVWDNYRGDL